VSIKAEIDENKTAVVISISDNGMGIAQENLPDVFLRFTRFCSDKSVAGSGLGLSVAKELAEMHDGNITISSELGKGSIFFIAIPTSMHQKDILEDE
ncbi:MAG: ATP-binding protein, partial [Raoultibacter sp.]